MATYVLDSNFFIEAHRASYPLDIAHSFWNKVKQLAFEGKIISIDKVKREIFDHQDALTSWCSNNLPDNFFKDTSVVLNAYRQVTSWAISSNRYETNALNEFLDADEADAFLIAYALTDTQNRFIVTYEVSYPNIKRKVKIPEPCNELGVRFVNSMTMFRELGETF